jgi:uncharacterized protein (TIGR03083 family)
MLKELEPIAAKLNEACTLLSRTLDRLTDDQAAQLSVNPEWSVKDTLAHLVGAKRGMTRLAQRFAEGQDPQLPADYNNDVYNARQVAKRKAMSLAEVRAEFDAAHQELVAYLDSITAQQLELRGEHPLAGEIPLKDLLVVIYSHETQHCKEIAEKIRELK